MTILGGIIAYTIIAICVLAIWAGNNYVRRGEQEDAAVESGSPIEAELDQLREECERLTKAVNGYVSRISTLNALNKALTEELEVAVVELQRLEAMLEKGHVTEQ